MSNISFSRGISTPMVIGIIVLLLVIGWLGYSVTQAPESEEDLLSDEEEELFVPEPLEEDEDEEEGMMQEGEMMEQEDDMMMKENEGEGMMMEAGETMMEEKSASEVKVFDLTGRNFSFSQSEIRVKKGDRVRINFTSAEGFHDWTIDEFNAKTSQVNTGGSASVEFVADKAGTFEYYCSVGQHRQLGMKGNLIVE